MPTSNMPTPNQNRPHLYLVDGSAYIFRAYHRLPPLTNPQGTPVGAVFGYTTMLWKLAEDLHKADGPSHLAVILDASGHTFRNEMYAEYKANRPPPPEDLIPQFPLIRDATRAFSLPIIEEENVEADDMIASYARAAAEQGFDVTIVSSDKDLMQLVGTHGNGAHIDMLDTMKNQRIDLPEVAEVIGRVRRQGRERLRLTLEFAYAPHGPAISRAVADELADFALATFDGVFLAAQFDHSLELRRGLDRMAASIDALAQPIIASTREPATR